MRDYTRFDAFIDRVHDEVYEQPESEGHADAMKEVVLEWIATRPSIKTVLDVGCGRGEAMEFLAQYGKLTTGVNLDPDLKWLKENKPELPVYEADMHFLPFEDGSFDAIFCRHTIEHSFMPLYALIEFNRVARSDVFIVVPPHTVGVVGDNHYSILTPAMWERLFQLAGFQVIAKKACVDPVVELRYHLKKVTG